MSWNKGARTMGIVLGVLGTLAVLFLLWLYFCMCILFWGAEVNCLWPDITGAFRRER